MDTTSTHAYKAISEAVGMLPGWIVSELTHSDGTWNAVIRDEANQIIAYASFEDHGRSPAFVLWELGYGHK